MSSSDGSPSASVVSTFADAGLWVLRRNQQVHDDARRLIARAKLAHDTATRLAHKARDLILTFRPHSFHPISGASGDRPELHESIWISTSVSPGARCTKCGRAIAVGEAMYDVVADGREMCLDANCGRLHMEQRRSRPEKLLRRVS